VTANGWRTTSNNTAKLARSPLKHACGIIISPRLALSRHSFVQRQCRFRGQSGHENAFCGVSSVHLLSRKKWWEPSDPNAVMR
jgi:hypothetical protein